MGIRWLMRHRYEANFKSNRKPGEFCITLTWQMCNLTAKGRSSWFLNNSWGGFNLNFITWSNWRCDMSNWTLWIGVAMWYRSYLAFDPDLMWFTCKHSLGIFGGGTCFLLELLDFTGSIHGNGNAPVSLSQRPGRSMEDGPGKREWDLDEFKWMRRINQWTAATRVARMQAWEIYEMKTEMKCKTSWVRATSG